MTSVDDLEHQILKSWQANAEPWTQVVRRGQIASRIRVTNAAILQTVLQQFPGTVLDLGCGEGWLTRALSRRGIQSLGIDAAPALIAKAQTLGGGTFVAMTYAQVSSGQLQQTFDVIACNFSLLGCTSVDQLLLALPGLLAPQGKLIIQTIHPQILPEPTLAGWRMETWEEFEGTFSQPAPWYYRPLEQWRVLLKKGGFDLPQILEPQDPSTHRPASLILIAQRASSQVRPDHPQTVSGV
ncbi:class I SAM-dependent methyltransferase [Lyngbya confervoides]|uniref:Methyltransferase domain-containing protein n=1 Tax=Lyngbya confervoides BDU141951 TaxID=1574623 RepID=A0ABD4T6G4_9CYAN|nr:class I SAM-dependent methyltransferase [Lyngbya confervoides]MCM1984294.1 methyltransferase domain-containing protein [Lyngbya confervoides BDU141951]